MYFILLSREGIKIVINKIKRRLRQLKSAMLYYMVFLWTLVYRKRPDIWLISERGKDARDNGYVFYRWLKENHREIPIKYVITDDSPDRGRVDDEDVIRYGTLKHYFLYITAPLLISTHYHGYSPNQNLFALFDKKHLIRLRGKRVLLEHCVRMGKYQCTKGNMPLELKVCGVKKEFDVINREAGFEDGVIRFLGMARFDNLYKNINEPTKPQILFMPTWRKKHTNSTEKQFLESDYYKDCMELINDKRLDEYLEKNGLKFIFYTHIEMQKFIHLFKTECKNVEIMHAGSAIVEDLLIQSRVMITDYSSVFFDFAYLDKPVIYYHFDIDELDAKADALWFNFKQDGLGPLFYKAEDVVNYIAKMDINAPEPVYAERYKEMFTLKDGSNCERNFEAIKSLI